jgi:D,D-heptose 1,7-bisphosphate phosphatase
MLLSEVAILAGGKGTRLKSRTGEIPKPMALIMGKPVLEHQILLCKKFHKKNIALLVHYEYEKIKEYFGDGSNWGVKLTYIIEKTPRGTAGALYDSLPYLCDEFIVLYGDTFLNVNISSFFNFHKIKKSNASILIHPNDHPFDSDLVEINEDNEVLQIHSYPHPEGVWYRNLVNAALYIFNKSFIYNYLPKYGKSDLAKNVFPAIIQEKEKIFAYLSQEYIKDMGTPERLDKVESDIINGIPEKLSFNNKRRAIFLDRDGTINIEVNHLKSAEQFELIQGTGEAIRKINRLGMLSVCITNQPVIARGELTYEGLQIIHNKMHYELGLKRAYLDQIYVCPHHPAIGFTGEVKELKKECNCRKPNTGLIERAIKELNIDRKNSWFVGDTTSDIKAGSDAGLNTILVRTGHAGYDLKYDVNSNFIFPDLKSAVDFITTDYYKLINKLIPKVFALGKSKLILIGGPARSGKTTISQIIYQLLTELGKTVHVIELDGWILPVENRIEGSGVLKRYDLKAIKETILPLVGSIYRKDIDIPIYDRLYRVSKKIESKSIGPNDIILLEGVIALMDDDLNEISSQRIFVDVKDNERINRLKEDYKWRKMEMSLVEKNLKSRENEEVKEVRNSILNANIKIQK